MVKRGGSRNKNAKIDEPEQRRSEIFVNVYFIDTIPDFLCVLGIKSSMHLVKINIFFTIQSYLPNLGKVPTKIGHSFRK